MGLEPGTGYDLIERASAIDLMELASDFGPVPLQVGAILVSGPGESLAVGEVRDALADRICAIPRLRQQLVSAPPGCGRPVWVDDPEFDVAGNVAVAFAVLSYAGTLTVTVIADGDACPDYGALVAALQGELDALTAPVKT